MFYFYVLKSLKDHKLYKGFTADIAKRLNYHNSGKVKSTKNRKPFIVIYSEKFNSKEEALKKEKYFKTFKGGKELSSLLKNT